MNLDAEGVRRLAEACGQEASAAFAAVLPARLAALPPRSKYATVLHFGLDGRGERSIERISQEMRIPISTARQMIYRVGQERASGSLARLARPVRSTREHRRAALAELAQATGHETVAALKAALAGLREQHREILALRYGLLPGDREGRPGVQLARERGVTRQNIDEITNSALENLRRARRRAARQAAGARS